MDVRFDGFRMRATKERVPRTSNFVAGDAVALEKVGQKARCGAVHGVGDEAKLGGTQAIPIDEFLDGVQVGRARLERMNQIPAWRERWHAILEGAGELRFDLRDDGRQRATAVAGFVLDAVPAIRI